MTQTKVIPNKLTKMPKASNSDPLDTNTCSSCHCRIGGSGWTNCPFCGHNLNAVEEDIAPTPPPRVWGSVSTAPAAAVSLTSIQEEQTPSEPKPSSKPTTHYSSGTPAVWAPHPTATLPRAPKSPSSSAVQPFWRRPSLSEVPSTRGGSVSSIGSADTAKSWRHPLDSNDDAIWPTRDQHMPMSRRGSLSSSSDDSRVSNDAISDNSWRSTAARRQSLSSNSNSTSLSMPVASWQPRSDSARRDSVRSTASDALSDNSWRSTARRRQSVSSNSNSNPVSTWQPRRDSVTSATSDALSDNSWRSSAAQHQSLSSDSLRATRQPESSGGLLSQSRRSSVQSASDLGSWRTKPKDDDGVNGWAPKRPPSVSSDKDVDGFQQVIRHQRRSPTSSISSSSSSSSPAWQRSDPLDYPVIKISNLVESTKESDIYDLCENCGSIYRVYCPLEDRQFCRGFAFVTFKSEEGVRNAFNSINGIGFQHRMLRVVRAQTERERRSKRRDERTSTRTYGYGRGHGHGGSRFD